MGFGFWFGLRYAVAQAGLVAREQARPTDPYVDRALDYRDHFSCRCGWVRPEDLRFGASKHQSSKKRRNRVACFLAFLSFRSHRWDCFP